MMKHREILLFGLAMVVVAGCSSSGQEQVPTGLSSAAQLQKTTATERGKWTYRKPGADMAKYQKFMFEPVVVYSGADNGFGSMSAEDRTAAATAIGEEFAKVIGEKYPVVTAPGPDVLRFRLTLIGVETTVGGVATVTRILPIGIAVNAVKGASGGAGSFTGSIDLALEIFDSQSDDLLAAAIRHQTPAVYDVEATLSTSATVRSSAHELADQLLAAINKAHGKA
jgi:hypothetical protein